MGAGAGHVLRACNAKEGVRKWSDDGYVDGDAGVEHDVEYGDEVGDGVGGEGVAVFSALTTEPTGWYQCVVTDGSLRGDQRLLFVR